MLNRKIVLTNDGSHTVYDPLHDSHFHSIHGAITESKHVFIKHGLECFKDSQGPIRIFEMGFGTGLNAYLSLLHSRIHASSIQYDAIEVDPLVEELVSELNYSEILTGSQHDPDFMLLHTSPWNLQLAIHPGFYLNKMNSSWQDFAAKQSYDLVYFDAFDPRSQGELWDIASFEKLFNIMKSNSILCTYCAKGIVKRNLKEVGFKIESLPGPPGKREMTRAIRL